MRLWSLHPKYLDSKGLVALWREGLLAKAVLEGKTKGYKNHPQLLRFKNQDNPVISLNTYLNYVYVEAKNREYHFNREKIGTLNSTELLPVKQGQLLYELEHLKRKLKLRDMEKYNKLKNVDLPLPNPLFKVVKGDVEPWERIKKE
jgi:hypothetical protein